MTYLKDVFNIGIFNRMIREGYIRVQHHPTEPLSIFNYTEKATFDREWNDVTRTCRGLIVNTETLKVVARPFPKFFNWNEPTAPDIKPDERVHVLDKVDGSLGILYRYPSNRKWGIATRGSFTSDQAIHASDLFRDSTGPDYMMSTKYKYFDAYTQLFEIVYPANRVVLDYGDSDYLFYLGAVVIETGFIMPVSTMTSEMIHEMGFQHPEIFGNMTMNEALSMPPRPNSEGIVLLTNDDPPQRMVKIKQEDYVRMHKTIFGLNARVIWERMRSESAEDIQYGVPEEFWPWIMSTYVDLSRTIAEIVVYAKEIYRHIVATLPDGWTRKDFALMVRDMKEACPPGTYDFSKYLFLLLDGKSIHEVAWKAVKPSADSRPTVHRGEDVA